MILKPEEQEKALNLLKRFAPYGYDVWDAEPEFTGPRKVRARDITAVRAFLKELFGHACTSCGMPHETADNPCEQCTGEVE